MEIIKKTNLYIFLVLIFVLPLLTNERIFIRPILLPATILWILSSALLLFNLIILYKNGFDYHFGILIIALYFIYEIARDFTSTSFLRALFGDARGPFLSVLTSISLFVVYLTVVQYSNNDKDRSKIIITALVSMSIVGIIAVFQHFMQLPFLIPTVRAKATLPNPVELASICLLMVGVAGALIIEKKQRLEMLFFIPLLILSLAIISTLSKIAIVLLAIYLSFFLIKSLASKNVMAAGLFLITIFAGLLVYFAPVNPSYTKQSKFGSTKVSEKAIVASMSGRKIVGETAISMWLTKPIFGWGQADFPNDNMKFVKQSSKENLVGFDVHNWVLDILSKGGIVKLFITVLIIIYFVRYSAINSQFNFYILIAVGFYFISLMVNPSYLVSKVYLLTVLGLISFKQRKIDLSKKQPVLVFFPLLFAYFVVNIYFGGLRLYAEHVGTKGINATYQGQYNKGIAYSKRATYIFPYETDYWSRLGWSYRMRYYRSKSKQDISSAIASYEQGLKLVPDDISIKDRISNLTAELSKLK